MATMWGVHNDHPELDLVENGFVSIGWDDLGDLRRLGPDRESFKAALERQFPRAKPGAYPVMAGVLHRFVYDVSIGDLVIYPHKPDSTLNFGRVTGEYRYEVDVQTHHNRRDVQWLRTGVPRTEFSQAALYEIGSAITLFRVKRHLAEFEQFLATGEGAQRPVRQALPTTRPDVTSPRPVEPVSEEEAVDRAEDVPNAERIETFTRDFIVKTLLAELGGYDFEYFVADLLEATGYKTRVTPPSGDGGVDVIAHKDPLGLEPPIIKVQCKRYTGSVGIKDVQRLVGSLAPDGTELGLLVTLGSFTRDAVSVGLNRQRVRLMPGDELVELVLDNYDRLPSRWRQLLPLKSVYVVDDEPATG